MNMLLMVKTSIRGWICHAIHQYVKGNNKYMKDCNKNKELPYLKYWDINNLYGWIMSQNFLVNGFECVENTSRFNKDFIKRYNGEAMKDIFLKLMLNILKNYLILAMTYPF